MLIREGLSSSTVKKWINNPNPIKLAFTCFIKLSLSKLLKRLTQNILSTNKKGHKGATITIFFCKLFKFL